MSHKAQMRLIRALDQISDDIAECTEAELQPLFYRVRGLLGKLPLPAKACAIIDGDLIVRAKLSVSLTAAAEPGHYPKALIDAWYCTSERQILNEALRHAKFPLLTCETKDCMRRTAEEWDHLWGKGELDAKLAATQVRISERRPITLKRP